jgi:hypothetical protein
MMSINAQMIQKAIKARRPTSLTALWAALGHSSKPGQSARAQITAAMPNVIEELNKVKAAVASQAKAPKTKAPAPKAVKAPKAKAAKPAKAKVQKAKAGKVQVKSPWLTEYEAKEAGNPYTRKGTLYPAVWDSVKANPGKPAEFHIRKLAKLTWKTEENVKTAFNVVIVSAETLASRNARGKKDPIQLHRSARAGYTVSATNISGGLTWNID